ncbi:unnamed protein product [Vitrella brassicaformis CCMP3155]|uniref:Uncharacterized protein n=2 Tax=Vitrella brassicaformis TaxID=1169539 RepID=A0A0G4GB35_VITBC|nr:unnamed protein product [Vitrella brassicaformis CCMP3155]|eukprot:CEM26344.1 unnamed protein product [Vitrella brassicaformis CCMP3155]
MTPLYYVMLSAFISFLFLCFAPLKMKREAASFFGQSNIQTALAALSVVWFVVWCVSMNEWKSAWTESPSFEDKASYWRSQRNLYIAACGFVCTVGISRLSSLIK